MNYSRALPGHFGKDVDQDIRLLGIVPRVSSLSRKTAHISQALGAAEYLDIFIEYLLSGRSFGIWEIFNLVWIFQRRGVLHNQTRYFFGRPVTVMAGVTSDFTHTLKIILI